MRVKEHGGAFFFVFLLPYEKSFVYSFKSIEDVICPFNQRDEKVVDS